MVPPSSNIEGNKVDPQQTANHDQEEQQFEVERQGLEVEFCLNRSHTVLPIHCDLLQRIAKLLGPHNYVSVELRADDDSLTTVHITRPQDASSLGSIHAVERSVNENGHRLSALQGSYFFSQENLVEVEEGQKEKMLAELGTLLDKIDLVMEERAQRKTVLQLNPQGFVERGEDLILGIPDTGGQNRYLEDMSTELARQGFQVIIANRSGPSIKEFMKSVGNHSSEWDKHDGLRTGMHYKEDQVDLLFIDDGHRVDGKPVFVPKEEMYESAAETKDRGHFAGLARDLFTKLGNEQIDIVVGHYADGGEVGRQLLELLELKGHKPKLWHIPHSTADLKGKKFREAGTDTSGLRLKERQRTEQDVYSASDRVLATSQDIKDSLEKAYGVKDPGMLPPGVDDARFRPRDVPRSHQKYAQLWNSILDKLGLPSTPEQIARLQRSKIVLECSRTDKSKDKATVLRSFARAFRSLADQSADPTALPEMFLVLNINHNPEYPELCNQLWSIIREEQVEDHVAVFETFSDQEVSQLYQVSDLYISASQMEGFGMSVQQAAASRIPVISSTLIPFSTEVLGGKEPGAIVTPAGRILARGPGALLFPPNDYEAAAYAIELVVTRKINEDQIGQAAYDRVIPRFTWPSMVKGLIQEWA